MKNATLTKMNMYTKLNSTYEHTYNPNNWELLHIIAQQYYAACFV